MPTHRHHADQRFMSTWAHKEFVRRVNDEARRRRWPRSALIRYALARALGYAERDAEAEAQAD